ncbi:hypothetical protein [Pleionea sediminis]|uniref:hypothetical protein n=1 Tax=Pleionea sediminis TaxID=2569479 RepID=UPI0013DE562D|nr:hypothetical protein [Pleionea sediminis]
MQITEAELAVLNCPKTNSPLSLSEGQLVSEKDSVHYPIINDVPWLLKNPLHSMVDWTIKLNHFNQVLTDEIRVLVNEIKKSSGETARRLTLLCEGKVRFQQQVTQLVAPILKAKVASKPIYDALSDRAPHTQNLLSYEANLYRDWVWGGEENNESLDIIKKVIDEQSINNILVLGAGSCRLAYDLHCSLTPKLTLANDINPLLLFAAKEILWGDGLTIEEFPLHPKAIDSVVVTHEIESIKDTPDNFSLLFSDATKPAIKAASMDTVVTPWLIDIQPFELSQFLAAVNHYLPRGGQWINFGSLVFNQNRDALCYSIDEIKDVALKAGFEIEDIKQNTIPYLKSPYNAGYRMETVWSWRAVKVKEVQLKKELENLPDWLIDIEKPVPNNRTFQSFAFSHQLYLDIASKVDGKKSIKDIAKKFAKERSIEPNEATSMIKDFYLKIIRESH